MSKGEIKTWQVLREDRKNIGWINGRYVGVLSDEQVAYLEEVCPTRAPDLRVASEVSQPANR